MLLDQADHLVVQPVAAFERHSYPNQRLVLPTDLVVEMRSCLIVLPTALPKYRSEPVAGQFARLTALRLILVDPPVGLSVPKADLQTYLSELVAVANDQQVLLHSCPSEPLDPRVDLATEQRRCPIVRPTVLRIDLIALLAPDLRQLIAPLTYQAARLG